ncbi:transcriptional regulator, AsnC family [Geomicrobium sp. JCM 19037]|uniref:Lrp/AsnC family transcriptional regulator n=1 Tax=Geomicrobium sp. JCM 19037 TaxID=1460634 RepID=UPI00045F1970|nr:Lrp/AsnC family transcriptional regulator [Geomicrobium sp. JCM 19037]GAK02272.1 transcriptional regulator, AsnC family [Geomicrobium sp. JCM 19037]
MVKSLVDYKLDDTDRVLLELLQQEAHLSNVDLARRINLSPPATHARVKRLEEAGIIERYVTILNKDRLGFDLLCFIYVGMNAHQRKHIDFFQEKVVRMPEVLECHHVTGEYDYILKVLLKNSHDLKTFIVENLSALPSVTRIQTSVSYGEVKSSTALPIQKEEL